MFNKCLHFVLFILFNLNFVLFGQLKVGIVGDQTGSNDLELSYLILREGCKTLEENKPDIVLHVGDLVESSYSNYKIKEDFTKAVKYLNDIKVNGRNVLWYITAGDHDVNPPGDYKPGTKNREKEKFFHELLLREYMKRREPCPLTKDRMYYSFNFEGYHFVSLYSENNLRTDPRWGNIFMDRINDEQFEWLQNDLKINSGQKGVIVFIHQPMWYNWTGWQRVHELLRQYNVLTVIAGHFHYNQDEGAKDGIKYIVVGSTGGNIKNASENAGGLHHVTMMNISDNGNITFNLIPLEGYMQDTFTSREDMDRIQAIDTMISMFPYQEKYKGSAVEANPVDLPVNVKLSEDGKSWSDAFPQVEPGTGIMISNLSSVELNGKSKTAPSPGGTRVEFTSNGVLYWNQILY